MTHLGIIAEIAQACKGLVYVSETDGSVSAGMAERPSDGPLSATSFKSAMGMAPLAPLEVRDFTTIMTQLTAYDPAWTALEDVLRVRLEQLQIFVTTINPKRVYFAGILAEDSSIIYAVASPVVET